MLNEKKLVSILCKNTVCYVGCAVDEEGQYDLQQWSHIEYNSIETLVFAALS